MHGRFVWSVADKAQLGANFPLDEEQQQLLPLSFQPNILHNRIRLDPLLAKRRTPPGVSPQSTALNAK